MPIQDPPPPPGTDALEAHREARRSQAEGLRHLALAVRLMGADPWEQVQLLRAAGHSQEGALDQMLGLATDLTQRVAILCELFPLLEKAPGRLLNLMERHGIPPTSFLFGRRDPAWSRRWMERLGLVFRYGPWVDRKAPNLLAFRCKHRMRTLPEALAVAMDLRVEGCHHLEDLGGGISAASIQIWRCSRLQRLPLDLECTSLEVWGCNAFKGFLGSPDISEKVRLLECTNLEPIGPPGVQLPSLHLTGCLGRELIPEGTSLRGDLNIRGCPELERLPDDLSVGGSLGIWNCPKLAAIPDGLRVGGPIELGALPALRRLPPLIASRPDLRVYRCKNLEG